MFGLANAAGHALGLQQAAATLPFTARSLTRAEIGARTRGELIWVGQVWLGFLAILGGILAFSDTVPARRPMMGWMVVAITMILLVIALAKWRTPARYQDPRTQIEVTDADVQVRRPAGSERLPFADLAVVDIMTRSPRNSVYFEGIELETSAGPLKLGDKGFEGGNKAAGAILRRMQELGHPLRLRGGILS